MLKINFILATLAIMLMNACSVSSPRQAAPAMMTIHSFVKINRNFEIPSEKARVYIQHGIAIEKSNIDKSSSYCSVLMQNLHSAGKPKLSVAPGQFEIIKLRKFNDSTNFPGIFFTSRGRNSDFPEVVVFELEMRLKSVEQPAVRALICAKQATVYGPLFPTEHYPTLVEIKTTLANAIEILQ